MRIPPHVTLVPPVNVAAPLVGAALATLRAAAAAVRGPLQLSLGPVCTFAPANPVLYLRVGGDLEHLRSVRDAAFTPPFERHLSRPWVPHVTVARDASADRIAAAVAALDRYTVATTLDRVVLLVLDEADRRWTPLADAALGPPAVVGTGGGRSSSPGDAWWTRRGSPCWGPSAKRLRPRGPRLVLLKAGTPAGSARASW